jgi:hypothetical protein
MISGFIGYVTAGQQEEQKVAISERIDVSNTCAGW